ncbi:hypothetical protein KAT82_06810 [bacterium]|nr:hypothetical protein [bacterium]
MNRACWRTASAGLLALAAVLLVPQTCLWAQQYFPLSSPTNLMHNLQEAHKHRDAQGYIECLSDDFVFIPSSEADSLFGFPPPGPWDRTTEEEIYASLWSACSDCPEGLEVTFRPIGPPERDPENPNRAVLRLNGHSTVIFRGTRVRAITGHILDLSSPSGNWQITQWQERTPFLPLDIASSEPVWERIVACDGGLVWYGHAFNGVIWLKLEGVHLTINGSAMPLPIGAATRTPDREQSPRTELYRRALQAGSAQECAAEFLASDLVADVEVAESAVYVRWVGDRNRDFEVVIWSPHYSPVPELAPSQHEQVSEWLSGVADALEEGYEVWARWETMYAHWPGSPLDLPPWAIRD